MLINLAGITFLGGIIVLANLYQAKKFSNRTAINALFLMLSILVIVIGGLVLLTALASSQSLGENAGNLEISEIPTKSGITLFVVSLILGVVSISLTFSRRFRSFLQKHIVRSDGFEKRNHADSVVHTLAIIIMFFASVNTIGNFIVAGGIEGIAEQIGDIGATDLLVNFLLYVTMAILGVGVFIRRDIPRTIRRLGIRLPEKGKISRWMQNGIKHLVIGAIVGFGMFWVQVGLSMIWQLFVSPETLAEQTAASQALFAALGGSLWLGFLIAFTAGVGEELLFRGALQPIFGNLIVSIFFVMLHSQYILTPASLIILLVSLVFGSLRSHYTTPTAMMAHFVYNFTPFVILTLLTNAGLSLDGFIF